MARIEFAEIFLVNLEPKVVRVDAIQQFVSQETVIVRVHDAEGLAAPHLEGDGIHRDKALHRVREPAALAAAE